MNGVKHRQNNPETTINSRKNNTKLLKKKYQPCDAVGYGVHVHGILYENAYATIVQLDSLHINAHSFQMN